MLHIDINDKSYVKANTEEELETSHSKNIDDRPKQANATVTTSYCATKSVVQALLSIAIVFIRDNNGEYRECRALLDSAFQSHFITKNLY